MTDAVQIALIVAIPTAITAAGGIVATVLADRRANRKLNHITVLTNSTLTAANARIDQLEGVIKKLIAEAHSQGDAGESGPIAASAAAQKVLDHGEHGEKHGV